MNNNTSETGKLGEDIATSYLKDKGWALIERNFRQKWGELDIIAKDPKGVLVFIEVKTMNKLLTINEVDTIKPEDQLTSAKLKKLQRTASLYIGSNQDIVDEDRGWRIDLLAITLFNNGTHSINYYENI